MRCGRDDDEEEEEEAKRKLEHLLSLICAVKGIMAAAI